MIKISVITPIYNMEKYIKYTIESVLQQTVKEVEMICVDDGSLDTSSEVIKQYIQQDNRVKLVQTSNQGAGKARNIGMNIAQGEYVFFLDADDWLYDCYALENLYTAAKQNDIDVCGGRFTKCVDGTYDLLKDYDIYGNEIFTENKVIEFKDYQYSYYYVRYIYRRKMLIDNRLAFSDYKRYEDPPFFLSVMAQCKRFMAINEIVYCYRCFHKKISWTEEKVSDLYKGVRDCLAIAKKMNWEYLYVTDLKKWKEGYINLAIYAKSHKVLEIVDEVMDCIDEKILENRGILYKEYYIDIEEVRKKIDSVIQYEEFLLEKVKATEKIILYGAGLIGKKILHYLKQHINEGRSIVFAVSNEQKKAKMVEETPVFYISELLKYKGSAEVIVAVNKSLQEEIETNLKSLGFENIILLNNELMEYLY